MGLYYARVIETDHGLMAVIADEEVMGKAAIDEERGVRIIITREFYGERVIEEGEALDLLERASVLVLAGDRIIEKAVGLGLVHPESVLEVGGLRLVQVFKFSY